MYESSGFHSDNLKPQQITPCLLLTLQKLDSSSGEVTINNQKVETVELFGRAIEESSSVLRREIKIDDCTASQAIFFYIKPNEETPKAMRDYYFIKHSYVRVIGLIRRSQGILAITGLLIENITSRTAVNDFFSRVCLSYIKSLRNQGDAKQLILNTIKRLECKSSNGVNIEEIREQLKDFSESTIEDHCIEMMNKHQLAMGLDWRYYKTV